MQSEQNPEWQDNLGKEAMKLGPVLFHNFKFAMEECRKIVPNPTDTEQLKQCFNVLLENWIGGFVNPMCTFGATSKGFEDDVVELVRQKFQWIRDREKELQLQRLEQISDERKTKSGLVIAKTT